MAASFSCYDDMAEAEEIAASAFHAWTRSVTALRKLTTTLADGETHRPGVSRDLAEEIASATRAVEKATGGLYQALIAQLQDAVPAIAEATPAALEAAMCARLGESLRLRQIELRVAAERRAAQPVSAVA